MYSTVYFILIFFSIVCELDGLFVLLLNVQLSLTKQIKKLLQHYNTFHKNTLDISNDL